MNWKDVIEWYMIEWYMIEWSVEMMYVKIMDDVIRNQKNIVILKIIEIT
jgi:hypothetical protein